MNSHIQMPRCVYKQFSDNNNNLYYIDLKDNDSIKKGHAKSLNTARDYYTSQDEEFFSKNIESNVGQLINIIKKTDINNGTISINSKQVDIAFNYLYLLLVRSPSLHTYKENPFGSHIAVDLFSRIESESFLKDKLTITYTLNTTDCPFVIPNQGLIRIRQGFLCPITPLHALRFSTNHNETNSYIDDKEICWEINKRAIKTERDHENNYIASNSKLVLEELLLREKMN